MSDKTRCPICRQWYKVVFPESFYDGMVGWPVDSTATTITLDFGKKIGQSTFFKHQLSLTYIDWVGEKFEQTYEKEEN